MVAHELVLRGGTVVDGTGAPARTADVAISQGRISAVGSNVGRGEREVDLAGAWLMPGVVDPHTHLDAQLLWDPSGSPSVDHGVTTVVTGACGFGIAPCAPGAEDDLLRALEAVEEIPLADMRAGVTFGWESFGEYLDRLDDAGLGVNVAALVPHSPLRRAVLGAEGSQHVADADGRARLQAALRAALVAGAIGFASSRGPNHVDGDGHPVASRAADDEELEALVSECRGRFWQINVASKGDPTGLATGAEVDRYAEWSGRHGARLSWTPLLAPIGSDGAAQQWLADHAAAHTANGTMVLPQVCAMPLVSDLSLTEPSIARSLPVWSDLAAAVSEAADPVAVLRDPVWQVRVAEAPEDGAMFGLAYDRWTVADSPSDPAAVGADVRALGARRGSHPGVALMELLAADALATVVQIAVINLDAAVVDPLVAHPATLVGLGDSGAHVRSITNFAYPTYTLRHLVLDRGVLPLETAVRRMTSHPARVLGLRGRGELVPGAAADVWAVDPVRLDPGRPTLVRDLPAGGDRLVQHPTGVLTVLVGGVAVAGELPVDGTGTTTSAPPPGRVLRGPDQER